LTKPVNKASLLTRRPVRRARERWMQISRTLAAGALLASAAGTGACAPTIKLAAPDKPIEINLNVKIDQTVRVQIDKDLEDLIAKNPDLF
jgi:hypothetical protein